MAATSALTCGALVLAIWSLLLLFISVRLYLWSAQLERRRRDYRVTQSWWISQAERERRQRL